MESRSDVYASIAVVIGILGAKLGFHWMDPLGAIVVGLMILRMCIEMIYDAVQNLMDRAPEEEILQEAAMALSRMESIESIKNIQAREVGTMLEFQVELNVSEDVTVAAGESIKKKAKQAIIKQLGKEAIVQVRLCAV